MKNLKKYVAVFVFFFVAASLISCGKSNVKPEKKADIRIVSLGPSATEILFAIGANDELVARTDLCDYPEEAKDISSVGGFSGNTISLESILSFEPTLVYLFAGMHDFLIEPLEAANIQVYVSNANSIDAVKTEILDMGKITGHEKQAQSVIN
ncbi:MAG: ABC transporter substrate-binding protein [Treponema sp.]|nr:ABC transporter substrate-binding protein [Treponema sp.]